MEICKFFSLCVSDVAKGADSCRMKFKNKRDNVKAKHATFRELQGIDPLDYLAKCVFTM